MSTASSSFYVSGRPVAAVYDRLNRCPSPRKRTPLATLSGTHIEGASKFFANISLTENSSQINCNSHIKFPRISCKMGIYYQNARND
jgi:hypothetical protein